MKNIYVAGHRGMVGSAISRRLKSQKKNVLTKSRTDLDLTSQADVSEFFHNNSIDEVYLAAARVGGIHANNTYPAEFIYENLMIESNIIHSAHQTGVQKLLFLGSSCIYPKYSAQPMQESALLTGELEPTNEPYAVAKIAGIKLCESYNRQYGRDYRSVMPTNLYGENDNFNLKNSHVIPALLRKFDDAVRNNESEVVIWGTGNAMREFLHVDDMASACIYVMGLDVDEYRKSTSSMLSHINVGAGLDCSIRELAEMIAKVTGFEGSLVFDITKPDGAPKKLMDISRLRELGWSPAINLEEGLRKTYAWFIENKHDFRS